MLFKKRKASSLFEKRGPVSEIAWDDKTIKRIAESESLNVRVTNISKTVSLGQTRAEDEFKNKSEFGDTWRDDWVEIHPGAHHIRDR